MLEHVHANVINLMKSWLKQRENSGNLRRLSGLSRISCKSLTQHFNIKFNRKIYSYARFIKIQTEEEDKVRNERLEEIQQNHAAKVIQGQWKQFNEKKKVAEKEKKALKSKKKK